MEIFRHFQLWQCEGSPLTEIWSYPLRGKAGQEPELPVMEKGCEGTRVEHHSDPSMPLPTSLLYSFRVVAGHNFKRSVSGTRCDWFSSCK